MLWHNINNFVYYQIYKLSIIIYIYFLAQLQLSNYNIILTFWGYHVPIPKVKYSIIKLSSLLDILLGIQNTVFHSIFLPIIIFIIFQYLWVYESEYLINHTQTYYLMGFIYFGAHIILSMFSLFFVVGTIQSVSGSLFLWV